MSLSCRTGQRGGANAALHALPNSGGRVAAIEAARLVHEILSECNTHPVPWTPWTADVSVSGIAASHRVERRLKVGFWPNGSLVRIESVPQDASDSFVLLVSGGAAPSTTLLLDRGSRVLRSSRTSPVLAKVIGVPFEGYHVEALLRGCYPTEFGGFPTLYGDQQLLIPFGANGRAYYQREPANGPWRLQTLFQPGTGIEPAWRMDFFDLQERRRLRFVVSGVATQRLRLDIRLSNVMAASLPPAMFEPAIPSTSRPISLDDIDVRRLLAR
jgi:hypothetical protein